MSDRPSGRARLSQLNPFVQQVVPLDWWPVSRDCLAYGVTVAILICIIHDERVEWYEALSLVLLYIVYIAVMYYDKSFQRCTRFRRKSSASPEDLNVRPGECATRAGFTRRHAHKQPTLRRLTSQSHEGLLRFKTDFLEKRLADAHSSFRARVF